MNPSNDQAVSDKTLPGPSRQQGLSTIPPSEAEFSYTYLKDAYDRFVAAIVREDSNIKTRLSFMFTATGLLLTAMGVLLKFGQFPPQLGNIVYFLLLLLPLLGVAISYSTWIGVKAAGEASVSSDRDWQEARKKAPEELNAYFPESARGGKHTDYGRLSPGRMLPCSLVVAWALVFAVELYVFFGPS